MAWICDPNAPLPSGADHAATAWLKAQPPTPDHVLRVEHRPNPPVIAGPSGAVVAKSAAALQSGS